MSLTFSSELLKNRFKSVGVFSTTTKGYRKRKEGEIKYEKVASK